MPDPNTIRYRRAEIQDTLDAGPADDETWFRLQIRGKRDTKHLNVSPAEVAAIRDLLEPPDDLDAAVAAADTLSRRELLDAANAAKALNVTDAPTT